MRFGVVLYYLAPFLAGFGERLLALGEFHGIFFPAPFVGGVGFPVYLRERARALLLDAVVVLRFLFGRRVSRREHDDRRVLAGPHPHALRDRLLGFRGRYLVRLLCAGTRHAGYCLASLRATAGAK